jgi:hypothetical protein
MRIIRTVLLLTGIGVAMPSPPDEATGQGDTVAQVNAPSLLGSAAMAVGDVVGFCQRQPDVCQTASRVAARLEVKAKYSVRLLYEWANDQGAPGDGGQAQVNVAGDQLATSSTEPAAAQPVVEGQTTLRIDDLLPKWREPTGLKKS